jgi:photosystem II PsbU protein
MKSCSNLVRSAFEIFPNCAALSNNSLLWEILLCFVMGLSIGESPSLVVLLCSSATAFVAQQSSARSSSALSAAPSDRRAFFGAASVVAAAALVPTAALAVRDYENVGYLGGSEIVDINNANVRVYLKMPGMYPTVAGKVASGGPYSSVSDVYNIPGLTGKEKEILKKYESRFVAKKPEADYVIDKINNGLYR